MTIVTIIPEPGNAKTIAKELLALADSPLDVNYVLWPEEGFRVPEALAAKFVAGRQQPEEIPAAGEEIEEPVKRKPGRPKKIQGGQ